MSRQVNDRFDRVACVVVTYRRVESLRRTLDAVEAQTRPPDAVYVIDNESPSRTESMLRQNFDQIFYDSLEENLGVGAGLARGIDLALDDGAQYVWMLDDDSIPDPNTLEHSLTFMRCDAQVGLVGYAGGALRFGLPRWFRGRHFSASDDELFWADFVELDGSLISSAAVRAAGLPRSDFFMMMEGLEYSNRVARSGFKVACFVEDLVDRTHLGARAVSSSPWRAYYQTRNHLAMALEHRSPLEVTAWGYRQAKFILRALLNSDRRDERIRMRALGAWHGLRGVMGRTLEPSDYQ